MNIHKLLWCGMMMIYSTIVWGQGGILLKREITWREPVHTHIQNKNVVLLDFSGMAGLDETSGLPYYFESIALPSGINTESVSISLNNQQFIWPLPDEHLTFKDAGIPGDISYNLTISQTGDQFFADVSIIPLKMESGATSFQKLKTFEILIHYNPKTIAQSKLKSGNNQYVSNSALSEGSWKKISVSNSGIHKITYNQLADWGISNPANVGIYGNGGRLIPILNSEPREDDLVENAVLHYNNAVYFYAEGPVTWEYDSSQKMFMHTKHPYSDKSYYFITQKTEASKTVSNGITPPAEYDQEINTFIDYDYHEENEINLISSGSKWFGEKFEYYGEPSQTYSFSFPNINTQEETKVKIALASRSGSNANFKLLYLNDELAMIDIPAVNTSDHLGYFAREAIINEKFTPFTEQIDLNLTYNNATNSIGYLDYICINATRSLTFVKDELLFRYVNETNQTENLKFNLSNSTNDIILWDITNPFSPQEITSSQSGNISSFNYSAKSVCEFVAFDPSGNFQTPKLVGDVENQNLHGLPNVEYLIVCHPDFIEQAERLGKIHNEYSGLSYAVVTNEQIYNEFSSGKKDVTAIRSFLKMFYDRAGSDDGLKPKNVLLFGDGSYDNRPDSHEAKIITYQSVNSVHRTNSYVSDDYFGLLDDTEGSKITSEKIDIGIGRFPVNTLEEAKIAVDKTERYLKNSALDSWKGRITFVGDDGDSNIHMNHANLISEKVNNNYPQFNLNKVFFDAFTKAQSATGGNYPEVEDEIYNALHEGSLVFNYTGHGGPEALAHEHVITFDHIKQWQNYDKLPIFITATCEFSRYDDHEEPSAGEFVFTHELGGGIALYTTTRIVYSSLNYILNNSLYDNIFELDEDGQPLTLGEIMRRTKNNSGSSVNKLNFTLLGDPAIKPLYPKNRVNTLKLNNKNINEGIDDLLALSNNNLSGEITDGLNQAQSDFNGEVIVSIFDKRTYVTTLNNTGEGEFNYEEYDNIIFRGRTEVVDGKFEMDFIVPKDIRYNFDNGKISYYAFSDDNKEAFGAYDEIVIGGMVDNAALDQYGPDISLFLNDRKFTNGLKVGPTPLLIVDLYDESGINMTGIGIGHDITCVIDGNKSNPIILNNYFESDLNNYKKGTATYQLPQLESGVHNLTVKAWDTYNNSSEAKIEFIVSTESAIEVTNIKNYPNPIAQGSNTYFYFEHDEPNSILNIEFNIYTLNGSLVKQFEKAVVALHNTIPPVEWTVDVSPGIYIYDLIIYSQTGRKGKESGKIMVIP